MQFDCCDSELGEWVGAMRRGQFRCWGFIFWLGLVVLFAAPKAYCDVFNLDPSVEFWNSGQYVSGRELLAHYKRVHGREPYPWYRFVKVPVHPNIPLGLETEIFVFTYEKPDPNRPSVIHFTGGPGKPAHDLRFRDSVRPMMAAGYNVFMFDQRGLGFSRPEQHSLYLDRNFYSSKMTVADVEVIRQALGLKRTVISGSSYGTVPATLYASRFSSVVKSVFLTSTHIGFDASRMDRMGKMSRIKRRPPIAFGVSRFLDRVTAETRPIFAEKLERAIENWAFYRGTWDLPQLFDHLNILDWRQELLKGPVDFRRDRPTFSTETEALDWYLKAGDISIYEYLVMDENFFRHDMYPISAPVTYLHGQGDPRTPVESMLRHFRAVPYGLKQALIVSHAGHEVGRSHIQIPYVGESEPTPYPIPQSFYQAALAGIMLDSCALALARMSAPPYTFRLVRH